MNRIIGRQQEIRRLKRCLNENEAQLIVVYGRRRVGKTFLINEFFGGRFDFKLTGVFDQPMNIQLKNFIFELNCLSKEQYDVPKDWMEAFMLLRNYLNKDDSSEEKKVVFFDEMPWMDTQKSGFMAAFEWFWNSWGSTKSNLIFVICGSATSWMVNNLDENKGGLFNRQTCRIYLKSFSLGETEQYLESRNIMWSRYDITQCYMIMGGIPYYLRMLDPELSLNNNIDNMFFRKRAELWDEFEHLYRTLFNNSSQYVKIVSELSKIRRGLSRGEIIEKTGLPGNGVMTKMLNDLENSGFIRINDRYGYKKREKLYQLSDYYSMFYFRFIKDNYGKDEHMWSNTIDNPSRRTWMGLTFEQVCKDHIEQIKMRLGISGVMTQVSSWWKKGDESENGAEIDLLIERRDRVINLCEIKFSTHLFEIKKEYDETLKNKLNIFREETNTNQTIIPTMITTFGVKDNKYSNFIGNEVVLDDLFNGGMNL